MESVERGVAGRGAWHGRSRYCCFQLLTANIQEKEDANLIIKGQNQLALWILLLKMILRRISVTIPLGLRL